MTNDHTLRERQRIQELASEYLSKGYSVTYPQDKSDLPDFLQKEEYIPDLIVTSIEENLIVEVKSTKSVRHDKHIARVSELVKRHPDWQFVFVLTNPKRSEEHPTAEVSRERWHLLGERSRRYALETPEFPEAAFVLAWAALEGAIREAASSERTSNESKSPGARSPLSLLRDAAILGLIDRKDLPRLERLFAMRSSIVHGIDGPRPAATDISFLHGLLDEVSRIDGPEKPD